MAVVGGLAVDGPAQVEVADDGAGAQVEVLAHQAGDLLIGDLAGAEGLNVDGEWAGHADGVGHLNFAAVSQAGGHHVLGSPARRVGRGAVHFCGVLAAEGAAAMAAHAAVGVDDDLATGDAGVSHGSADDKAAGGVDVDLGIAVEQVFWNDGMNDVFDDGFGDISVRNLGGVLGADEHGIDPDGFAVGVLDGHLALAVGAQPGQGAVLAHFRQAAGELVRQVDGHGHESGGLIAGVAEHHTLVTGSDGVEFLFGHLSALGLEGFINAHGNIARLSGNGGKDAAGVTIEALLAGVVADIFDHLASQHVEVDEGGSGDLAQQDDETGLGGGFAGHARAGILLEAGVEDGVADLIAEFIGMTFGHRLRGEHVTWAFHERT